MLLNRMYIYWVNKAFVMRPGVRFTWYKCGELRVLGLWLAPVVCDLSFYKVGYVLLAWRVTVTTWIYASGAFHVGKTRQHKAVSLLVCFVPIIQFIKLKLFRFQECINRLLFG